MSDRKAAPDRDLLLQSHQFPGQYVIKAFGATGSTFERDAENCAVDVVGADRVTAHTRSSSGGRRSCVTLTLSANTVDEVIATYERLHALDSLLLIL
ncbi:MAG: DUF493 family protein [Nannocystaceae bacterium]|nr:DUF493 domain-containing protein [bacterium]